MSSLPASVLEQLLALARRLTSRRDLDDVLVDLFEGSLQLIVGSDFACVFLYDVEENELFPVGGVGFDMRHMVHVRLKPGESLTGQAFSRKQPLLLPTPDDVRNAQANLEPANDRWVRLAVGRPSNPVRSSLAVPLSVGDRTVGVLVVDNYDTDRNFTSVDLQIAAVVADHAAIAVANAQDYHMARSLSKDLQHTLSVQHKLLGSLLSPSSSFAEILHTLVTVIRRPASILDSDGVVVAQHARGCVAGKSFTIQTGTEMLGYLKVAGEFLGRAEQSAVDQAIPLIALEFMKRAAVEREQSRLRADLIYRVLNGDPSAIADVNFRYLQEKSWQAFAIGDASPPVWRMLETMTSTVEILSATIEQARIVVGDDGIASYVFQWASDHPEVVLICGDVCTGASELARQIRGVLMLWKIIARRGLPHGAGLPAAQLRDFPDLNLINSISPEVRHGFITYVLGPILGDPLSLETLQVWLFANRSYRRAADRCGLAVIWPKDLDEWSSL